MTGPSHCAISLWNSRFQSEVDGEQRCWHMSDVAWSVRDRRVFGEMAELLNAKCEFDLEERKKIVSLPSQIVLIGAIGPRDLVTDHYPLEIVA